MKIGIFDSGIGGLSVLYEAIRTFPTEQFIYYADEVHVPYGEKTQEEIQGYVEAVVEFMLARHVKAIVIACNTATSVSVKALRERYDIPIIGMEPAVKKAIDLYGEKRVLVTATPITVKGAKMKMLVEKVDKHHQADLVALPGLVRFAEKEEFDPQNVSVYLKEALGERNWEDYSSLVLGGNCKSGGCRKNFLRPWNISFPVCPAMRNSYSRLTACWHVWNRCTISVKAD